MSIDLNRVFDLERNVFVEACAGAGKTWLLSKRYAAIMNEFARQNTMDPGAPTQDASNILVITFTKKAQAEMSGRIYEDLNTLLNDEQLKHVPKSFGQELRKSSEEFKTHLRATFSQNSISTIDSFCTQVLRDHAEKLDLDPEFRIQDEADVKKMEMETWEAFLKAQSEDQNEDLVILLDHLSIYHLEEYIKKLKSNSHLLSDWLDHYVMTVPRELIAGYETNHPVPIEVYGAEPLFKDLVSALPDDSLVANTNDSVYQNLENLKAYLHNPYDDHFRHGLELLQQIKVFALTQKGTFRKTPHTKNGVWSDEVKNIIRNKLKTIIEFVSKHFTEQTFNVDLPNRWDLEALIVQHHLAKFFSNYWSELAKRFNRENVMSFNEIIVKAHDLLKDKPDIAAAYGRQFTHILFDEFQDTNDLRWEIVRMVASSGTDVLRERGLFIVGDTKQSIYRFNQADVQVMNTVRQELENTKGFVETADVTYRSSRSFVDSVINPVVGTIFHAEDMRNELPLYDTYFKPTSVTKDSPLSDHEHTLTRSKVTVVLDKGTKSSHLSDIYKTADAASAWLQWLHKNEIKTGETPSIGVLLRSAARIIDYIRIFTAKGIDYEVVSSKGLFEQQESFDIYHFLSVLVNPHDDIALVGLLRSPFFILKDAHIQELRNAADKVHDLGWVWSGLGQVQPTIYAMIKSWRSRCAYEPIDRILTDAIAEGERQLGWISETNGQLRIANIHRLIDLIHSLSLDGLNLREVQEYMRFQIQHGEAGQAEQPGSAKVQIMTIHKAKGLEFPVVIIPECQRRNPTEKSGMFIGKLQGKMTLGIQVDTLSGSEDTSTFTRLKEIDKLENEAEDKRLFYVALTRAKYGVEFISRIKPEGNRLSGSWWESYLKPGFKLEWDKEKIIAEPETVSHEWLQSSTETEMYELVSSSALVVEGSAPPARVPTPKVADHTAMIDAQYEEISPHTIMNWMMQDKSKEVPDLAFGSDYGDLDTPRKFGTLLHKILEMEWLSTEAHAEQIQQYLDDLEIFADDREQVMVDLADCVSAFTQSKLFQTISSIPPNDKLAEMPVFGFMQNARKTFKVSGIIDLLYFDGHSWIILDYKSDRELPEDMAGGNYAYWFQIQTYLWILRLMYGIIAKGVLYFNRLDKTIEIEADETLYFKRLSVIEPDLKPVIIHRSDCEPMLEDLLKKMGPTTPVVLFEPTKTSVEYLSQALADRELLRPRLHITTLNEYRKRFEQTGRHLTTHVARLGVANLLPRDTKWGTISRMAEACYRACQGEAIADVFESFFEKFMAWCSEHNIILPDNSAAGNDLFDAPEFIVHSIHSTAPQDYEFLKELSMEHTLHFLHPLEDGALQSGFSMSRDDWNKISLNKTSASRHTYLPCFSIQEEVSIHARRIRTLLDEGTELSQIGLAVSSMEKYVPAIKRVFRDYGISIRLNKREPILERPVVQLAMTLLKGRLSHQITWDSLMSVWLHPLVIPKGKKGEDRLKLDVEVRRAGLYYYDSATLNLLKLAHLERSIRELKQFVEKEWYSEIKGGVSGQVNWLVALLDTHVVSERMAPGSVALKSYNSLQRALTGISRDWSIYMNRAGNTIDLYREIKERLKGVEVASRSQGFGVDVISYLDSLNLENQYLFIAGMNEGQFPLAVERHPYLKTSSFNPWYMNVHLFNRWTKRSPDRLFITAPDRDAEGKRLQISTFCQYLGQADPPALPASTYLEQLRSLAGKLITDPSSSYTIRHNELLNTDETDAWSGRLQGQDVVIDIDISASAMDDLLKCPQRYWYKRQLSLTAIETDLSKRDETWVGNLVHKVLEVFGEAGGFKLAANDLNSALIKLQQIADKLLAEKEDLKYGSALAMKRMEPYFKNCTDQDKNLIAYSLSQESGLLKQLDTGFYEQKFGYEDEETSWPGVLIESDKVKLRIRGKIDRARINDQYVWGTDYKTGEVEIKDTREFWTSQMLYYYLALKLRYPEKEVVMTYGQLKSFKDSKVGLKGFVGEVGSNHPVIAHAKANEQISIDKQSEWSYERIQSETLEYARHIAENYYPLTERDEKIACKYCDFERICRKTSLPR
ncbi:MAG: UvrD-helicase domain-containing protein [Candidatus Marinimicrobia bacterium]|nr:UvrD-helicase domain-containing protein [Candidatus Neomarinimicrobiota bacterium]MCF7850581.1 UvrD-helicase domain-containing protein [Candidatus Neomarinimicrobiota bacterium]MCF7903685.1 UvrD-helicase domain-containing protein [Candidatus Neomarinimicrobiota bacterium]